MRNIEAPDWDTSKIEAMSREELEHKLVVCINHLVEGVQIVDGANETIKRLAESVVILGTQLADFVPDLKDATDQIVEKAKELACLK